MMSLARQKNNYACTREALRFVEVLFREIAVRALLIVVDTKNAPYQPVMRYIVLGDIR